MNEYNISDYGIFSDAVATTNACSNSVTTAKDGVTACKTIVSSESVFMGPMADKCTEALTTLDTDCTNIITNLGSMSSYLVQTSGNYQAADQAANAVIGGVGGATLTTGASQNSQALVNGGTMYTYTHNGQTFNVTNTKINVDDYAAYIQKNKMYQNAGFLGSQCMLLSQYYASDMLRGEYTSKDTMANHGGSPAVKMNERTKSSEEQPVKDYMYQELSQGHPVVLQVTQKRSNEGLRHLVTAVGYSSNVSSSADLTPENILVLDCVDGKVQTLSERNRKLYAQGGNYQALGPTNKFLAAITPVGNTANA